MDAKKLLIMEAAKKSFSLFGYKGTTMDQIAKIAGVGKATMYTFFANKEVLLHDIVQSLIAEMKAVADKAIAEGATPLRKFIVRFMGFSFFVKSMSCSSNWLTRFNNLAVQ